MSPRRWRRALLVLVLPWFAAYGRNDAPFAPPPPPEDDEAAWTEPRDEAEPPPEEAPAPPEPAFQSLTVQVPLTGRATRVGLQAPSDWIPLAASASRAELMGPDRRSRIYLRAMPALPAGRSCSALARDYAREVMRSWGGPPRSQLVDRMALGPEVTFELARRDPRPDGELVLGRVFCQEGVLVVVTCAGPAGSQDRLRPLCASALGSVSLLDDAVASMR